MNYRNECKQCGRPKNGAAECPWCVQVGKRHAVQWDGEEFYLTVTDLSLTIKGPNESDIKNQDFYQFANLVCRLTSKLRAKGGEWPMIIKQFESVSVDQRHKTFVREMLGHIKDDQGVS